ncbi:MAG: PqqD family protein [Holophagae bacterium]
MSDTAKLAAMLADDELTTTKLVDGTGVILDVDTLQVFTLNETGMFLVEALGEGVDSRDELVARLVDSFEVEDDVAVADVDAFIGELATFLLDTRKA